MTMHDTTIPIHETIGPREFWATRVVFFISGCAIATWAPMIPLVKASANLDEATLGLLLLCLGCGSITAMPAAGLLCQRIGCRRTMLLSLALVFTGLPALLAISAQSLLFPAMLAFGAGLGMLDCVMNIQAVIVERASGKSMMSGFHGLYSVGNIAGAGSTTLLLALGTTPLHVALCMTVLLIVMAAYITPGLLTQGSPSTGKQFALPRGIVLFIGILCFIAFLTEGAILDWSAVFLINERDIAPAYAGLGFTLFAITMTLGRLSGDRIVQRFGAQRVMFTGALLSAGGVLVTIVAPGWQWALSGYALVGAGCSNIVPVLFSAAGRQRAMPEHIAIPAITTLGYAGILVGPALLGFIAHASNLATAFAGIIVLLLIVALSSRYIRT